MVMLHLGELEFPPTARSGFFFNSLTDWYALSDSKAAINERPQSPGAFGIGVDNGSSLAISFTGGFLGYSPAQVVAAMESLTAVRVGGRKVWMTLEDDLRTTSRLVSVRSITPNDYRGRDAVEFAVDVVAADPLRYGDEVTAGTGLPSEGGGLIFDAPSGFDPLVGLLTYPGDDVFPSESLFPGGFE